MSPTTTLNQLTSSLSEAEQQRLQQGEVVLIGEEGIYAVLSIVTASLETVWNVLTAYEAFPDFLPSVVACRILERRENRILVERKDRRKIGWLPIKVKIVTENVETFHDRIDYRMVEGTLDHMHGNWQLVPYEGIQGHTGTLLMQKITAKANMGPLQPYFYEVFETGLIETMTDLRTEMEQR
ncbi:SRPBCC family protein [Oscillatoria sp. CS-180]|uniref:SRPBCC family protein n=1 Tax=Oscillatoria sp. CS-180 TaxID=3021720 RepID=UPI00232C3441|nr:SRPBCC family protein [Oscillatoria sp. CS-180]MDB9525498.1 SRPBCC family protein [Oscillatoria sp. CS-180]